MTYKSTVTSKGTITIAAPLRQALGIKPGQTVNLRLNEQNQMVIDAGIDMSTFEKRRARIIRHLPEHLKGLSGEALRAAAAEAWTEQYRHND